MMKAREVFKELGLAKRVGIDPKKARIRELRATIYVLNQLRTGLSIEIGSMIVELMKLEGEF